MNYKTYGYQGKPGTCLWCGSKLRYEMVHAPCHDELVQAAREAGADYDEAYKAGLVRAERAGPYQDDMFDTAGCGYWFGRHLGRLGHRLNPI